MRGLRPPFLTWAPPYLTGVLAPAHASRVATITANYLLWIAGYGAERGVATGAFLRELGLGVGDGERRIAIEQLYAAWELVARALHDPALPIAYAERLRIEDHHVLGFAAMSAPTLAESLRTMVRFAELASDSGTWTMDDRVRLVWQRPGLRSLGLRLANEAVFCELVVALRQIVPGATLEGVSFRHPRPPDQRAHLRFFQAPITWSAAEDALLLDRALLSRVPASENPRLMAYFAEEAERRRAALAPQTWAAQVIGAFGADLSESPAPAAIARRLGVSASGLREHLKREGTSFRTLLDTARRERAAELLQAGERSISEIALSLGFSETSAFTRAYTRWHGVPPRQHRSRS